MDTSNYDVKDLQLLVRQLHMLQLLQSIEFDFDRERQISYLSVVVSRIRYELKERGLRV